MKYEDLFEKMKSDFFNDDYRELLKETINECIEAARKPAIAQDIPSGTYNDKAILASVGIPEALSVPGFMKLGGGSIVNTKNTIAPWVHLSPHMEAWFKALANMVKHPDAPIEKVLQESQDEDGGYLVPEEFRALIVMYDSPDAVVWPRATQWPMNRDKLGMPKLAQTPHPEGSLDHFAGVAWTWTEEGGTKTETEPQFDFLELVAHELSGYTEVTDTLLEDSAINLANFLTSLFRMSWIWVTDQVFIRGNGARKPLGVVQDPGILTVNRQNATRFRFADAINMHTKLPSVFDVGSVWMLNKAAFDDLRNDRDSNNALILKESWSIDLQKGYVAYLLGVPVVLTDGKTYTLGTKGDVILGNWKWYYIGLRKDFRVDMSKHYKFRNNKTAFRVNSRLDGQCAIPESFVVLDVTTGGS